MKGSTHALAGVLIGLVIAQDSQPLRALALVGAAAIGALLPDIDHPYSIVGRRAGLMGGALRLAIGHRGVLHSGLAAGIAFMAAMVLQANLRTFGVAAACGYASHIILDALTIQGVPLLWPSRHRFRVLALSTGGVIERVGVFGLLCLICWLIWSTLK